MTNMSSEFYVARVCRPTPNAEYPTPCMLYFTRMKITLPLILETLHSLALALWAGGQCAVIIFLGVGGSPHQFLDRIESLIELSGIAMIGVQFLTRQRYRKHKRLYLADGIRHLLT